MNLGRSFVGIAGANPAGGMDVCILCVLCVVRYMSLRQGANIHQEESY